MKKTLLLIIGFFLISLMSFGKSASSDDSKVLHGGYISLPRNFGAEGSFFKETKLNAVAIERHRVWLNLTNDEGAFKQVLVGYITGATNGVDTAYDGLSIDSNKYIDFYSRIDNQNYVIQGRALPFNETDKVPLGYKTAIEGTFEISIAKVDGLFATQNVFVEDKVTHIIHNLKNGSFSFTTGIGVFNDRFVLRYTDDAPVMPPVVLEPPVVVVPPVIMPPAVVDSPVVVTPPIVTEPPVVVDSPIVVEPVEVVIPPIVAELPIVVESPVVVELPVVVEPVVSVAEPIAVESTVVVDSPVNVAPEVVVESPVVVVTEPIVAEPSVVVDSSVNLAPEVVVESPVVAVTEPIVAEPSVAVDSPVIVAPEVVVESPVVVELPVVVEPVVSVAEPIAVESTVVVDSSVIVAPGVVVESPVVVELPVVLEPVVVLTTPIVAEPSVVVDSPVNVAPEVVAQRPVIAVPPVIVLDSTSKNPLLDRKEKSVVVSVRDHQIKINSLNEIMSTVVVYDLKGRMLYENGHINDNEFIIQELNSSDQFLIVVTELANKNRITKKIVL
ncbi:T9SS sorting signal type C domain-containing protein [Flavobacterium sp. M31R6]|uniref:T9SS sorting signal type C domain-containing protein n=1 Tax=Flavobacterium sp. M31R6 TaxID=2739062 RepID=UPI0015697CE7|nr:T9SS sorting signal type C domain-containing protein [Flavobacterium sp. M31R6]QKJ62169.1 T9SS sorting signal type C domain-containing protein [Flavobacterium sp. M31R6]